MGGRISRSDNRPRRGIRELDVESPPSAPTPRRTPSRREGSTPDPHLPTMKILLPGLLVLASLATSTTFPARRGQEPASTSMKPQSKPKQKITTFLWFNEDAEDAIRFYSSIFPDSKVLSESRWGEGGPVPKGKLMSARFTLAGQEFMALN